MPGSILNTDTNFPRFTGEESTEQKIEVIMSYLFQLQEQLRYSMGNLGMENFNDTAKKEFTDLVAKNLIVTEVHSRSEDGQYGLWVKNGNINTYDGTTLRTRMITHPIYGGLLQVISGDADSSGTPTDDEGRNTRVFANNIIVGQGKDGNVHGYVQADGVYANKVNGYEVEFVRDPALNRTVLAIKE